MTVVLNLAVMCHLSGGNLLVSDTHSKVRTLTKILINYSAFLEHVTIQHTGTFNDNYASNEYYRSRIVKKFKSHILFHQLSL
jgi:hypothetical protein